MPNRPDSQLSPRATASSRMSVSATSIGSIAARRYTRLPRMRDAEFRAMLALDDRHWWYRGRRRIVRAVLDGARLPPSARVLDAGCGSGRTLDELAAYGRVAG